MNKIEIEEQMYELAEQMYRAGFRDGKKEAITHEKAIDFLEETGWKDAHDKEMIEHGMNMAWECLKKVTYPTTDGGINIADLREIFGSSTISYILSNFSPSEVIQKIKDWEKKQKQKDDEILVGDEVIVNDIDCKAIVIGISTFEDWDAPYNILFENGNTDWVRKDIISKTGKHYSQIEEVLKKLRGDEE